MSGQRMAGASSDLDAGSASEKPLRPCLSLRARRAHAHWFPKDLKEGVEIVIATPGRLIDFLDACAMPPRMPSSVAGSHATAIASDSLVCPPFLGRPWVCHYIGFSLLCHPFLAFIPTKPMAGSDPVVGGGEAMD